MSATNVMFMQSQTFFGADSAQHALIMRHLDPARWRVHVAVNPGEDGVVSSSLEAVRRIPDAVVRPTPFGRGFRFQTARSVKVRESLLQAPGLARAVVQLGRYVRREQIRIVHCTEKPRDAITGYLAARIGGATCVVHVHVKAETWINAVVRKVMKRSRLIAISEFVAGSLRDLGYEDASIDVVLNAMDDARWDDQLGGADEQGWRVAADADAVRAELGLAPTTALLACVARLNPWKGQLDLIRALPLVTQHVDDIAVLIVGEPDDVGPGDPRFFDVDAAKRLAADLGVADHVIFTGYRRDVPRLMAACDVYAMPSFEEPFGMVYLEAMALGKPVVSLDNGGTREVVVNGETGLLSPPGDAAALAANLVTLLRDPELARRMGAAGRRRFETVFTPARLASDIGAVYERILGGAAS